MAGTEPGTSNANRDVNLSDIVRALRRGAPIALPVTVAAVLAAFFLSMSLPSTYQASVGLLASSPPANFGGLDIITPPAVDPRVYQRVLLDGDLIGEALFRLDGVERSEAELRAFKRKVGVAVDDQQISAIVRITVRDTDPQMAARYADALATELVEWDRARARLMVDNTITALEQAIAEIDDQIGDFVAMGSDPDTQRQQALAATLREQRVRELEVARARGASAVMVGLLEPLNRASVPDEPVSPRPVLNAFIAVVLGLFFGYGVQFAAWSLTKEVRTRDRLETLTDLPVFATLPRTRRGRRRYSGDAIGYLRTGVQRGLEGRRNVAVALTSPAEFDDKAGLAVALAESLSRSGNRVLVIDGDVRQQGPGLGLGLDRNRVPGVEEYLSNPGLPLQAVTVNLEQHAGFEVLPAGTPVRQANELLEFGFEALIEQATLKYDFVIVDLPPVLKNPDAVVAAPSCAGVVICAGTTSGSEDVALSIDALEGSGAKLLGSVLSGVVSTQENPVTVAPARRTATSEERRPPRSQRVVARVKSR